MTPTSKEFIAQALFRFSENLPRIEKSLAKLTEVQVWQRPNEQSNSIGNLIVHLCGNITQYITSSIGGIEDKRTRDLEFSIQGGLSKAELLEKISQVIEEASSVIENISEEELLRVRFVQGFEFSGLGNILHVIEHYSYHTGQIACYTKLLTNKDLGFYADMDLNVKNEV